MTISKQLDAIYENFTEKDWYQGITGEELGKVCVVRRLENVYDEDDYEKGEFFVCAKYLDTAINYYDFEILPSSGDYTGFGIGPRFNDHPDTTFEMVEMVIKKAIEFAKEDEKQYDL